MRDKSRLPQPLFVAAGALTLLTLLLLWRLQPDLFLRTFLWARALFRYRMEVGGMNNVPPRGAAILVTDAPGAEGCLRIISATDRVTHFLMLQENGAPLPGQHLAVLSASKTSPEVWEDVARKAKELLAQGEVIGLSLEGASDQVVALLDGLMVPPLAPVVPVHYTSMVGERGGKERVYLMGGPALPAGGNADTVRAELGRLRSELEDLVKSGAPIGEALAEAH